MFTIDPGNYIPFLLVIFLSLVKPSVELLSNFEKVRDNKRQAKLDFALCHFFRFGVSFLDFPKNTNFLNFHPITKVLLK